MTNTMKPTNNFRFLERKALLMGFWVGTDANLEEYNVIRVLQQWWVNDREGFNNDGTIGEWRDVPTVSE